MTYSGPKIGYLYTSGEAVSKLTLRKENLMQVEVISEKNTMLCRLDK